MIIIIIISAVIIVGILIWGLMTNWWKESPKESPKIQQKRLQKYKLKAHIPRGTVNLPIKNPKSDGFKIGQKIEIAEGKNKEVNTIVGFGPLILDSPLKKAYSKELTVTVISDPKKKFGINQCNVYNEDSTCKTCKPGFYLEGNKCLPYTKGPNKCPSDHWLYQNPIQDEQKCIISPEARKKVMAVKAEAARKARKEAARRFEADRKAEALRKAACECKQPCRTGENKDKKQNGRDICYTVGECNGTNWKYCMASDEIECIKGGGGHKGITEGGKHGGGRRCVWKSCPKGEELTYNSVSSREWPYDKECSPCDGKPSKKNTEWGENCKEECKKGYHEDNGVCCAQGEREDNGVCCPPGYSGGDGRCWEDCSHGNGWRKTHGSYESVDCDKTCTEKSGLDSETKCKADDDCKKCIDECELKARYECIRCVYGSGAKYPIKNSCQWNVGERVGWCYTLTRPDPSVGGPYIKNEHKNINTREECDTFGKSCTDICEQKNSTRAKQICRNFCPQWKNRIIPNTKFDANNKGSDFRLRHVEWIDDLTPEQRQKVNTMCEKDYSIQSESWVPQRCKANFCSNGYQINGLMLCKHVSNKCNSYGARKNKDSCMADNDCTWSADRTYAVDKNSVNPKWEFDCRVKNNVIAQIGYDPTAEIKCNNSSETECKADNACVYSANPQLDKHGQSWNCRSKARVNADRLDVSVLTE